MGNQHWNNTPSITKEVWIVLEAISKTRASCLTGVSRHLETIKALGLRPRAFICFSVSGYPGQTLALVFDLLHLYLLPFWCNMGTPSKYPQRWMYGALYRFVISVGVKVLVISYSSVLRVDTKVSSWSYVKTNNMCWNIAAKRVQ